MKILISCISFSLVVFTSCLFQEKHPDVDSFYTARAKYDFPRTPLLKPFYLTYDKIDRKWDLNYPTLLTYGMSPSNTDSIGIDKHYLYGYIQGHEKIAEQYKKGMFVHLRKDGIIVYPKTLLKSKDYIPLKLIDSTEKTFKIPNRWFVVNAKDSTRHVFLSKLKYDKFLNRNNISGKTYNTLEMHKQFLDTGILPWFPDSVKIKLSK